MRIESYRFGTIRIDGIDYVDDLMIVGGEVKVPWWRTAGGHLFARQDFADVLDASPEVVVLGTGYFGRVRVEPALVAAFGANRLEVVAEPTRLAVEAFNRIAEEGRDVAAALHLTC